MARKGWIKNRPLRPLEPKDVEPPAIFQKLYEPLGEFAVVFANMEATLTAALNVLLRVSNYEGAALESFMQNVSLRIELFYFLSQSLLSEETLKRRAVKLVPMLQQANADRNNLLHGAWTGLSPIDLSYSKDRVKAEGGKLRDIPVRGVSIALLKEENQYIIGVDYRLTDWVRRARREMSAQTWPPPLIDKYPARSPLATLIQRNKEQAHQSPPPPSLP